MHTIILCISMMLLVSSCARSDKYLVLGNPPLEVCNLYLKEEWLERFDGADFETLEGSIDGFEILIYVGLHPSFPGMEEIRKKVAMPGRPILLKRVELDNSIQSLYVYPTEYGFPGYVHLSTNGNDGRAMKLSEQIGRGFKLCKEL